MNLWEILGISSTTDLSKIRHAFAQKAKEVHPEEHPEEFAALRNAYKQACFHASLNNQLQEARAAQPPSPVPSASTPAEKQNEDSPTTDFKSLVPPASSPEKQNESSPTTDFKSLVPPASSPEKQKEDNPASSFDDLDELLLRQQEQNLPAITALLQQQKNILKRPSAEKWQVYFGRNDLRLFLYDEYFTSEFLQQASSVKEIPPSLIPHLTEWSYLWSNTKLDRQFRNILAPPNPAGAGGKVNKNVMFISILALIFIVIVSTVISNTTLRKTPPDLRPNAILPLSNIGSSFYVKTNFPLNTGDYLDISGERKNSEQFQTMFNEKASYSSILAELPNLPITAQEYDEMLAANSLDAYADRFSETERERIITKMHPQVLAYIQKQASYIENSYVLKCIGITEAEYYEWCELFAQNPEDTTVIDEQLAAHNSITIGMDALLSLIARGKLGPEDSSTPAESGTKEKSH